MDAVIFALILIGILVLTLLGAFMLYAVWAYG